MTDTTTMTAAPVETNTAAHQEEARKITMRRTLYAAGAGLIPVPILDAAALLGVQVFMIRDLAKVYGVEFKEERVKSFISILVGDVAAVGLFKFVPGLGTFFGGASAAAVGAGATYALGSVFSQHFAEGGTLLDFDASKSKEFFQRELEKGKKVAADLKNKATGNRQPDSAVSETSELLEKNKALLTEVQALHNEVAALRQSREVSGQQEAKTDMGNLQLVEGIGPKIAEALKSGGIADLKALAQATPEFIQSILDNAKGNFKLAVAATESWPQQAKLAVEGNLAALKELQDKLVGGK